MKDERASPSVCFLLLLAWLVSLGGAVTPAGAHGRSAAPPGSTAGLSIPSLTHGQMRVIADHRSAIMALAAQQFPTDPVMRRLQGFINLQRFACAWGIVPGSVADERSPFNECSHAYLAAARALLLHLRSMPGDRTSVISLVAQIERDMLQNGSSLVLCRYSEEPFNTANLITPSIGPIPLDPISVATLTIAAMLIGWATMIPMRWSLRRFLGGKVLQTPASASQDVIGIAHR